MTEDDARKKWCPMVRNSLWIQGSPAGGGNMVEDKSCNCIASDCMMWQWIQETETFDVGTKPLDEGWRKIGSTPMSEGYSIIWIKEPDEKTEGYCGLARKE